MSVNNQNRGAIATRPIAESPRSFFNRGFGDVSLALIRVALPMKFQASDESASVR